MITQVTIDAYKSNFLCQLPCLAVKYTNALNIGNSCADKIKCDMVIANYLLEILCLVKGDSLENCITEDQICLIITKLRTILKLNSCDCSC